VGRQDDEAVRFEQYVDTLRFAAALGADRAKTDDVCARNLRLQLPTPTPISFVVAKA